MTRIAHIGAALGLSAALTLMAGTAWAQAPSQTPGQTSNPPVADDNIEITTGIDSVSEYVFRGASFGGSSVQPYTEIAIGGLTLGSWTSVGAGGDSDVQVDEIDLYASYSLPLDGPVGVDVGVTYYWFPQLGNIGGTNTNQGSYEVYGSASFDDVALAPSAAVYYDLTLDTLTLEGSVGHSWDLPRPGWTFDLGLTGGHVAADGPGDYEWGTATAGFNKVITQDISFFVNGNLSLNSEDLLDFDREVGANGVPFSTVDSDTLLWAGTGITVGF